MNPIVSIIVPVYNAEATISRCIDSILTQEYTDFELILVDDGSQDSSGTICDQYASYDSRVRVIHKANSGVSDSRNMALDQARGIYIQFLDSDDWITPNATQLFVDTATHFHCDLVISDFYRVVGERVSVKGDIEDDCIMTQEEFAAHMVENPADFYYGVLWNKLYRRDIIKNHQLRMDTSISWCEDFMFNLEYVRHIQSIYALKVPVYYYVKTKGSLVSQGMSVKKTIQMKRTVFEYYNNFCKDVFDEEGYEKYKVQVYRFLIEAAGDGIVAPAILPGIYRLGAERTSVSEGVQEGEGFFFDSYRERKLQERLFDVVALKNELLTVDIKLLFYLSRPHENCTLKEMTDILDVTRRELSSSIQSLLSRALIETKEKAPDKSKSRKSKEKNTKETAQETKRKAKACEYVLTSEADSILAEALLVMDDFEQLQYEGFSQEEIIMFERLNEKRNQNIRKALK